MSEILNAEAHDMKATYLPPVCHSHELLSAAALMQISDWTEGEDFY